MNFLKALGKPNPKDLLRTVVNNLNTWEDFLDKLERAHPPENPAETAYLQKIHAKIQEKKAELRDMLVAEGLSALVPPTWFPTPQDSPARE